MSARKLTEETFRELAKVTQTLAHLLCVLTFGLVLQDPELNMPKNVSAIFLSRTMLRNGPALRVSS